MLQTFFAIAYKELLQLSRNTTMLRAVLFLQMMDVAVIAWIDTTVHDMPTVIVDQDHTAESRALINVLAATHTFAVKYATSSTEQARGHIRAGRARIAVIIPPDYARTRSSGKGAQILALVDGSDQVVSAQAIASLDGVAAQLSVEAAKEIVTSQPIKGQIEARPVMLFNPEGRVALFMLPGLLALVLTNGYSQRALSLAGEREEGNLERLLMTPMNYTGLILGKLAPIYLVALVNALLFLVVIRFGFGVPIRGSVVLLLIGLMLYIATFLSLSAVICSNAPTQLDASMTMLTIAPAAAMLSGYLFPLASLPRALLPVAYALPETHFIEIMRGVCLRGSGLVDLLPHFLFLTIAPILLIIVAGRRFARSVLV